MWDVLRAVSLFRMQIEILIGLHFKSTATHGQKVIKKKMQLIIYYERVKWNMWAGYICQKNLNQILKILLDLSKVFTGELWRTVGLHPQKGINHLL